MIIPYLIKALEKRYGKVNVLKKNNLYFNISCRKFTFKDALLFTSPCSLSKYLKQNQVKEKKSIFPYSFFRSIEEMRNCVNFPPHQAFFSELRNSNISLSDYTEAKTEFERRRALPSDHPDYMANMVDWLKFYNQLDTVPLAHAIDHSFGNFFTIFGLDPGFCVSLPKFAQSCMFRLYDKETALCYSFWKKNSSIRQLFRSNLTGGLVNVFHRCIDLSGRPNMPLASQFSSNGKPFTSLMFFDFNSLYLHAQLQPFPATPGIHWEKKGGYFHKKVMAPGCSLSALQWLTFIQETDDRLIKATGERVRLEHKYFRGEKSIGGWEVDGYAEVDNEILIFEFLGCFFHKGCPYCGNPREKDERFERKKSELEIIGNFNFIWECRWKRKLNQIKAQKSPSYPDVYNNFSNQDKILKGISKGELFGFIVADVKTPSKVLQAILPLNFPPIIQRGCIDETMVSDYMLERCRARGKKLPQETLIQTYNATQILIYTPTVEFYLKLGLEISNISKFIQYLPVQPLKGFVEKITNGRIQAVKSGNDSLGTAYKIIGNS